MKIESSLINDPVEEDKLFLMTGNGFIQIFRNVGNTAVVITMEKSVYREIVDGISEEKNILYDDGENVVKLLDDGRIVFEKKKEFGYEKHFFEVEEILLGDDMLENREKEKEREKKKVKIVLEDDEEIIVKDEDGVDGVRQKINESGDFFDLFGHRFDACNENHKFSVNVDSIRYVEDASDLKEAERDLVM